MMATVTLELSEGREKNLPPLSPNVEASQLLTPLQLGRITIDNPHYHDHLTRSMLAQRQQAAVNPVPDHQHVLHRRTAKLGDNYFFLQKDIPIQQAYARTALKLSDVRPWDQTVDRPLNSEKVVDKEVHLPFPQEHPYTSHISRFAVFPDTKCSQPFPGHNQPDGIDNAQNAETSNQEEGAPLSRRVSVHTQTTLTSLKPLSAYYVPQKAGEWGLRVEEHYLGVPGVPSLNPDVGRTFWDLPRSKQHKRANTYPAPRFLYSAQLPDTPSSTQHQPTHTAYPTHPHLHSPSSSSSSSSSSQYTTPPITPRTNNALESIHKLLTRSTTYSDHFPHHRRAVYGSQNQQNILRLDYSLRSCVSQRPWTNESRGKYCRRIPMSPRVEQGDSGAGGGGEVEDEDMLGASDGDGVVFSLLKGAEAGVKGAEPCENRALVGNKIVESQVADQGTLTAPDALDSSSATTKDENITTSYNEAILSQTCHSEKTMVDSCTQTEEAYFDPTPVAPPPNTHNTTTRAQPPHTRYNKLPQVRTGQANAKVPISNYHQTASTGQTNTRVPTSTFQPSASTLPVVPHTQPKVDITQLVKYPSSKRPLSAIIDTPGSAFNAATVHSQNSKHIRSYSADASLSSTLPHVRTAESTKRLMTLYNGFNKSEVMKKFHEQYPERAPDLRDYSIREGRRHVIHGSHAYYYH